MINPSQIIDLLRGRAKLLWDKFNRFSPRERNLALGAVAAIFLLAVNFGVIKPIRQNTQALREKIAIQEKKDMHEIRNIAQKDRVQGVYQSMLKGIEASSASDDEVRSTMLNDIEKSARSQGLYLSEVRPQVSAEKGDFNKFSVRLQVDGTLGQLMTFLSDLVRMRKLYSVETLRITPHPEDVHKIRASVTMIREVFLK